MIRKKGREKLYSICDATQTVAGVVSRLNETPSQARFLHLIVYLLNRKKKKLKTENQIEKISTSCLVFTYMKIFSDKHNNWFNNRTPHGLLNTVCEVSYKFC